MLNSIATLGPEGTFSELACKKYIEKNQLDLNINYYSSIKKTLAAVGTQTGYAVLPIENFSEGFVNPVLDFLVSADLHICAQMVLPIQFSLVSHCVSADQICKVYTQFVAQGQCSDYLEELSGVEFISTESNTQALMSIASESGSAAVIPSHLLKTHDFAYVVENITDYKDNQTRFLLLCAAPLMEYSGNSVDYKTSIVVLFDNDHPGYLESILNKFAAQGINLTSIVSRPTRKTFGNYHFFIDLDGHQEDLNIKSALLDIQKKFKVKILGSYLRT
ncbi:MAG: prephenate dehydratase [Oceanospirillaceae bacterium]|nr:prephenate dehydratase [Oceanospirillaceae bacterium]